MPETASQVVQLALTRLDAAASHMLQARALCDRLEIWGRGPTDEDRVTARAVRDGIDPLVRQVRDFDSMLAQVAVNLGRQGGE